MDGRHPVTLTPELPERVDVVAVTLRMPPGSSPFAQGFAVAVANVVHALDMDGVAVECHEFLLRVWIPVTGAEDREAAEAAAYGQAEKAAGGYLVPDRPGSEG